MVLILLIILCFISAIIFYQDWKSRSVQWFLFPLLSFVGIGFYWTKKYIGKVTLINISINFSFLFCQLFILWLVFYIKNKRDTRLFSKIGLGDVLFLSCTTSFFSPFNFFAFYILSLVFSLICFLMLQYRRSVNYSSVPLAGYQSIFLTLVIGTLFINGVDWLSDYWIIQLVEKL